LRHTRPLQSGIGIGVRNLARALMDGHPNIRGIVVGIRRWGILGFEIERKFLAQGDSGRGGKGARIRQADLRGDGKDWSLVRPAGQV